MCHLIYLASVEALPESEAHEVRLLTIPVQRPEEYADLYAVVPEARYLYTLGGCQCYFRYFPEEEINRPSADGEIPQDKEFADSSRAYLTSRNAFVETTAEYLAEHVQRTPIWMVWKWEGQPIHPECVRWTRTPAYFRERDFTMPEEDGVIALLPV